MQKQWQRQTQLLHNLEQRMNEKFESQKQAYSSPPGTPRDDHHQISRSQSNASAVSAMSAVSSSSSLVSPTPRVKRGKKQRQRKQTALAIGKIARLKRKRNSSPKQHVVLRKALGDALCELEPELRKKRCKYYDTNGEFNEKKFEEDGRIALLEAMGKKYDVDPHETTAAFQTACDIVKRRRKYLLKHPNAKVKKKRAAIRLKKPVKLEGGELDNLSFDEDQNDVEDEQHEHDVEDEQHEHEVEDKQDEDETEGDEDSVT